MGMTCELRQLSPAYAQKLLQNPDEVLQYYDDASEGELPEEAQGEDLDLDKAWHGLHYILTGTAGGGESPWNSLLLGGEQVGDEQEHDVGYGPARILLPPHVVAFSQALGQLSPAEVSRRFNPVEMTKLDIYPGIWDREDEALDDWMQDSLAELQSFLQRAVAQQQAVIVAIV
ncbi:YfbM family protein [Hymenobacter cheonanensis]|uniref:YfbM family protein n=1 Tax=Hymenobacter sp. CA2-7 TaxID=3063993 RepID=UPI002712D7F6|nr:YfbM family protein [Hymenobacter sp. CA2-7]MDO7885177.1 YfbM family protein [Hymenobacter sp. CA2-7]